MDQYLTPQQVCEQLLPGMTTQALKQLRYLGKGPEYRQPTPRKIFYRKEDVLAWVEESRRRSTADASPLAG